MKKRASIFVALGVSHILGVFGLAAYGQTGNSFGYSVAAAGDVNSDGYPDLLIGEMLYLNESRQGRVFLIPGGLGKIDSTSSWVVLYGSGPWDEFGIAVSGAGDLNGDGIDDFIVGAEMAGPNLPRNSSTNWDGRVYVYFGRPGFDGTGDDLIPDVTLKGDIPGERFGIVAGVIGDVNADGFDDVLVSDYRGSIDKGRAYLFFGGASMDSVADIILEGAVALDNFGSAVSGVKDVNGDSVDDFIVIAQGKAYLYFGGTAVDSIADLIFAETGIGASCSAAGDVNGDGFNDLLLSAGASHDGKLYFGGPSIDSIPDVTFGGDYDARSVAGVGDVNNDGYDDVVMAGWPATDYWRGTAYLYLGGNPVDSVYDACFAGLHSTYRLGWSAAGIGDFNGDSRPDWVVGAPFIIINRIGADQVFLVLSANPDTLVIISANGVESRTPYPSCASSDVHEAIDQLPTGFTLDQNYPNPFNPGTIIRFSLPERTHVTLKVFNVLGQEVTTLVDEKLDAGSKAIEFSGEGLPSGIYFYEVRAGSSVRTRKMVLLR
jgi:hypothetical protein